MKSLILTRQQKESLVIKLAEEGKSTRYIAQVVHISPKDIGTIIRRHTGEEKGLAEQQDKNLSINSRALKLLKKNTDLIDVAIDLNMDTSEVLDRFNDYLQLSSKDKLMAMYREMGDEDIQLLDHLYKELKRYGLCNKRDIFNILQQVENLKNLDMDLYETAGIIGSLNFTKMRLEMDLDELRKRIDHYDSVMEKYSKSRS